VRAEIIQFLPPEAVFQEAQDPTAMFITGDHSDPSLFAHEVSKLALLLQNTKGERIFPPHLKRVMNSTSRFICL
jgi:hypothetical protein